MQIVARAISYGFANNPDLFSGLSFVAGTGQLIGLTGPSGSGKSTLLSILAGFTDPTSGEVEREGVESVGWILQNPVGVPRRTALDHVVFPLLVQGNRRSDVVERARGVLASFGLSHAEDREYRQLSGGEAQRLAFARATVADYDALLLDEPTAQLDHKTAETVTRVVRGLVVGHRIVVIATHDPRLRDECDVVVDLAPS
jgi:lipoprotein-releasing system ATP-binding protein